MIITIEEILTQAVSAGASDVHITVGVAPRMRVNDRLIPMSFAKLMPTDTLSMLISIMSENQRALFEERGEFDMSFAVKDLGHFRVNAYKQKGVVAMVVRIVGTRIPTPAEICMPPEVEALYDKRQGLILVTGPAGSGKSTTLACLVNKINCERESTIITIEDPIEYLHIHEKSLVNQREVGIDTQSFGAALKSALREDPDVIMVSELPDPDTIEMAITAAEAGHLVLSTMHTLGAEDTINRLLDMFPPQKQHQLRVRLSNVLESVVSRQLLSHATEESRVPVFEVLNMDVRARALIREGHLENLSGLCCVNMDRSIIELYNGGIITKECALSAMRAPRNAGTAGGQ